MNLEVARTNMIKQQIRTCQVLDEHILEVIDSTPREHFVPDHYKHLAYADTNILLPHEEVMMQPLEEARMLQALAVKPTDTVLEIGSGTGYTACLFAKLAKHVYSIDIYPDFTDHAQQKLDQLNIKNVTLVTADAALGWKEEGPYSVIAITGSMPFLPKSFRDSLVDQGRLFAILGNAPAMQTTLLTRLNKNDWETECLFETNLKPLLNAPQPDPFEF